MGPQGLSTLAMKFFLRWIAALGLSAVVCAAQGPAKAPVNIRPDATRSGTCGPPEYCARTDRRVEPYPEKPPAIGAAGSIISDPTFGSRIVRVTDDRSDPKQAGRPVYTPSSAEQNSWNKDSTMFYVTTSGGSFLLYNFDPATLAPRPAKNPNLGWGGEPQFSFRQVNILYGMSHREPVFEQYDTSSGKVAEINDPSKCVKLGARDSGHSVTVSADDNRFMTTLGPLQDENYLVYIFDRTQGCRWYNPQTGEIGGQWGPKGTISVPDRFLVHNARMAKSGKFVYVTRGGGGSVGHRWVVWEIDTMNVSVCSKECSGHHVMGYSHIVGSSGMTHPMDTVSRPLNHLENANPIINGLEPAKGNWYDSHFSWNNVDANDSAPVCFSTYEPTNPDTPGAAPLVAGPWENEIDCAATDGKASKVWRFAHTYSTARNGFWSTPRGNVSQDGRFFMFTSDWEDQLGKLPNGDKYRTDVFIVELK
jgi:hypothetical protein